MPFTLTKGEFVPKAGRPDGDSIRFRPDNPTSLLSLPRSGRPLRVNSRNGTIQLRFEGIDTMESRARQPFSSNATLSNLELCGVPNGIETARGYILSREIGPNGRPICFVFKGDPIEEDGASVFLTVAKMKQSVNFKQLSRGHAYPLFYDTLFWDLRMAMAKEVMNAREALQNVWLADATESGATYSGRNSLETIPPIFPKLWRRLDSYSRDRDVANPESLDEFIEYLNSLPEERIFIISKNQNTGFDNIIKVDGNTIRMTAKPEDIVITSA